MTKESSKILHIDLETYSSEDLPSCGVYRYVESPDFEILLFAYAYDDDPVQMIDLTKDAIPDDIKKDLAAPDVIKVAHNCTFEINCLRAVGIPQDVSQWMDTMILAQLSGLPAALGQVADVLKLQEQKDYIGKSLIPYFTKPCKPTERNGMRCRNLPSDEPEKWQQFINYCLQDVSTERAIWKRLCGIRITQTERQIFELDFKINDAGVLVDEKLITAAIRIDDELKARNKAEMQQLTGLDNPGSTPQLKKWLTDLGYEIKCMDKAARTELASSVNDPAVKRVLELKELISKTSTSKYKKMEECRCDDGRVHGMLQYYGANRTGRWAGRLVQLHNLAKNHMQDLDRARDTILLGDLEATEMLYENVPDVLSQLVRTAFIAPEGKVFLVADYSAIEARVIAYLADEKWRQDVFAKNGDIYCASASQMFHVPVEKHGLNGHLRQKGKIAELALGYQGSVGAMKKFGADKMGMTEEEMADIVTNWRKNSPNIVRFWRTAEDAARAVLSGKERVVRLKHGVFFTKGQNGLYVQLPSKRLLCYYHARLERDSQGELKIFYDGMNQNSRKWERQDTYGGKLTENIVQAVARDCLAEAMLRLDKAGYKIVMHVHDEIITEAPEGANVDDMAAIMGEPVQWAPGLYLKAEGYSTKFYKKD